MNFFVIEGLDGSGKSTQIDLLQKHFARSGIKYKYLHFPRTGSPVFGELIARFLRGELGDINTVNPYLVALIYAGDRNDAAPAIREWLNDGCLVLLDRYVHSNIAFQCAKIKTVQERSRLRDWIYDLEYGYFRIPKPDLTVFLDVPPSFTREKLTQDRKGNDRDYLAGARDIHEEDLEFQKKVREMYLWQVSEDSSFEAVDCSREPGEILPPSQIFDRLMNVLGRKLSQL